MENASKALIIAGSMLISIIIISLLVMFFNQLSNTMASQEKSEAVMQATEFNKQFDVYERAVYGSELLSLALKVQDYNKREAGEKGYTEVKLVVDMTGNKIDTSENSKKYFTGQYTILKNNTLYDEIKSIEEKVKSYSSRDESDKMLYKNPTNTWSRTIAQLAEMRTDDWELKLEPNETIKKEINEKIIAYNSLKNMVTQFKQSKFSCEGFEYDKNTGRVKEMKFKYRE